MGDTNARSSVYPKDQAYTGTTYIPSLHHLNSETTLEQQPRAFWSNELGTNI